ncbi:MAG: class II aldolase/adducin family protein, partial [Clostridia bacterium]|nr:class II aldolase/adducin family protein [Clostridia bacterium]
CYDRKLLSAVQGCISVRFEDGMLITPAGKDHMRLKPEDIVRVKNGCCEKGKVPGEAANLHLKIYAAHSDIHSIIITHAPAIMGYAVSGKPFESETMSEGYVILGEVQQAKCENGVLDEDKIASMFGYRKNIVQLDNRCAIITGENLFKTFDKAEVLEYGAASVIAACGLGRPVPLSEAEIKHTNKELGL